VYANIAELTTNVTANTADDAECALDVVQEYQFVLGIAAGATADLAGNVWGPTGTAEKALFATTLASACAIDGPRPQRTAAIAVREPQNRDPKTTTTTLTRKQTYTASLCETNLVDCPASLLTVQKITEVETLITAVPSGVKATFPDPVQLEVLSTFDFGSRVKSMVSETPSKPSEDDDSNDTLNDKNDEKDTNPGGEAHGDGEMDGTDETDASHGKTSGNNNKLIIGLSVGLGVPFIAAVIGGFM
jgi:hypothetical protein